MSDEQPKKPGRALGGLRTRLKKPTRAQAGLGARLILGAATATWAVLAVGTAAALPWPDVTTPPPALDVTPAPAETVLACDGPLLALGRDPQNAQALTVAAQSAIINGNDRGEKIPSDALAQPTVDGEAAAARFLQRPDGADAISSAASSSVSIADEDLSGFAASACRPPQMESWIVGGDTATGTTGIVLIANPGDVDATVQITLYGVSGATTPPGAEAVPIPPRTQVALPIAGLAGGEASPVLRITATGSPVRATLQSSLIRTLDPGGIDLQSAVRPSTRQVIPGLRIGESTATAEGSSTIVRLLAQQDADVTVTVSEAGSGGAPARDPELLETDAGSPVDVDLGGLPAGDYTVTVSADAPLVAGVWQTTGFGKRADYAWHTGAPAFAQKTLFAVPKGAAPYLSIANPTDQPVTATLERIGGESTEISVPAGDAVVQDLERGVYAIDPSGEIHASVGFASADALASFALWPDAASPRPVTVYP